jgi:hypothetical protein
VRGPDRRQLIPIALILVILGGACAAGEDSFSSSGDASASDAIAAEDQPFSAVADESLDAVDNADPNGSPGASLAGIITVDSSRKVVSTASLTVEVESVVTASAEAVVAAEGVGGVLFAESTSYRDGARSVLTLKVPPDAFTPTLATLAGFGEPLTQEVSSDDVTERVVDLASRIKTAEASVDRLRTFLEGVTSVSDVAQIEGELLVRETDLENLQGQLRTLENQVDLATIVLTLTEPDTVDEPVEEEDSALPGFLDGLEGGWGAFLAVGTVALAILGALLPWIPLVVLALLAVRYGRRLRDRLAERGGPIEA